MGRVLQIKACLWFIGIILLSGAAHASSAEIEEILESELSRTEVTELNQSKISSLQEMRETLNACKEKDIIIHVEEFGDYTSYAFGCHLDKTDLTTSELLVKRNEQGNKIISYQELSFNQHPIQPYQFNSLFLNPQFLSVNSYQSVTPGIRALFSMAKVGVPVGLSLKVAKIFSPVRTDWQKHYIAGAVISGITILSTDVLIHSIDNDRLNGMTELQKNLLCSFAGLIGSVTAGIAKETRDKVTRRGTPEFKDALYTAAGGASVSLTFAIPIASLFNKPKRAPRVEF